MKGIGNMRDRIIKSVKEKIIIAIIRGMEPEHAVPLGKALYEGGNQMMEVTFNQACVDHFSSTLKAIEKLKEELGDHALVGAGTVLTKEQVDLAEGAGSSYIITPSTDPEIIRYARQNEMVVIPGAMTPSEAVIAWNAGADFVKLFPAGNLGASYVKAIRAPLSHIPFLAVGGINEKNIPEFLKAGVVGFGVGGNLVNTEWVRNGELEKVTDLARIFVDACER